MGISGFLRKSEKFDWRDLIGKGENISLLGLDWTWGSTGKREKKKGKKFKVRE